jgi:hypothetical protein
MVGVAFNGMKFIQSFIKTGKLHESLKGECKDSIVMQQAWLFFHRRKAEIKTHISFTEQITFNFLDNEKHFSLNVW